MKFKTREDIEATLEQVFEAVSDFDSMERAALRRGAEVTRTDTLTAPGQGMTWHASFPYRNRTRTADMLLKTYEAPHQIELFSKISGIEATVEVELLSLSRNRTRMIMSIDMRPRTIPARLLLQSMKLARATLVKRYRKRVAKYAMSIENRYRTTAHPIR
ncbi:DNA polymerase III subunit gamma/tau [Aliiroseovarius zhejiangensis]|uniref:DNA polymerase III subunit gamma/tau n=1 Tax=Aliiroseovarius zhejiangensis TaxID=1632025 RepID=A0ABQ3IW19_9RHOB|nr:SRPBCC family protein [Aliiroseovarius zhejiangensis]GHE96454.1 DNA polymerase III subunit gamma/tau [Aliiroseovarius zhejiangensis]